LVFGPIKIRADNSGKATQIEIAGVAAEEDTEKLKKKKVTLTRKPKKDSQIEIESIAVTKSDDRETAETMNDQKASKGKNKKKYVMKVSKKTINDEDYIVFRFSENYKKELKNFVMSDEGYVTLSLCMKTNIGLCDNKFQECYLIDSDSGAAVKITFRHKKPIQEGLVLDNDTRATYISRLIAKDYFEKNKIHNQKILFLSLKLYFEHLGVNQLGTANAIAAIDNFFKNKSNNFINVLSEIFGDIPERKTKPSILEDNITTFLMTLVS
jgi:hypothetical protein